MKSIDLRGNLGRLVTNTFLFHCRCTQLRCSTTGYSTTTTRAIFSSFALVLSSLLALALFHTFSLFFPRENSHQGLAALLSSNLSFFVRENFPVEDLPAASAIGFLSSCCSGGGSGNDSIPKHSGWEKERRREKERGRECNLPKSPSLAIPRDRLRFRAQIQQEFLAIRDALLFPFTNRSAVSSTWLQIAVAMADIK